MAMERKKQGGVQEGMRLSAAKVSRRRLNDIVRGRRSVTTETAILPGCYSETTPEFWINLQTRYDLDVADRTVVCAKIERMSRDASY